MTPQESELPVIARVASSTSEAAVTMEMFYKMTSVGNSLHVPGRHIGLRH